MFNDRIQEAIEKYGLAGVHPAATLLPYMSDEEYAELVEDARNNGFLHPARVTKDGYLLDGRNRLCASLEIEKDVRIEQFDPPDPIAYVLSENMKRRHLTPGQRAAIGADAEKMYADEAKERQRQAGGDVRSKANQTTVPANLPEADKPVTETCRKCGDVFTYIPGPCTYGQNVCNHCSADISQEKLNKRYENETRTKAAKLAGASPRAVSNYKQVEAEEPELAAEVRAGTKTLNAANTEAKQRREVKSKSTFNKTTDSIEWAKFSWNPVTGCLHDCPYCYARDMVKRYPEAFKSGFEPTFYENRLPAPMNTKPTNEVGGNKVFVCSMADLFGEWVPQEWIDAVLDSCRQAEEWTFIFLTKNPARLVSQTWPDNAWVGMTVDNQSRVNSAVDAAAKMADNAPTVLFVSCEPMTSKITFNGGLKYFNWVIIGGRSKSSGASAAQPDWDDVEALHDEARDAGCKVYWKPNLTVRPREFPL